MSDDRFKSAGRIHERARDFRGRFLNHLAVIERDIALLLTDYFCTEDPLKQELFFGRIACRMSLEQKRTLLTEIVKQDYPRYWDQNGQFLKDLKHLQELRNKLAHSIVDVSNAALDRPIEQGVGFVQWNEGSPITETELDQWCARANMVSGTLAEIKRLLPLKEIAGA
ncbi:MAG: hypothetical protein M3Q42_05665 [Pseudomonadota bacterium]|nr:hypothetical protein [Pseudomonadota bacterium]